MDKPRDSVGNTEVAPDLAARGWSIDGDGWWCRTGADIASKADPFPDQTMGFVDSGLVVFTRNETCARDFDAGVPVNQGRGE